MNLLGMILTKLYYMSGINSIFIELISIFLGGQFLFVLGIVIAKYAMFNKIKEKVKLRNINYFIILIVTIILIAITVNISVIGELIKILVTPFFIFILSNLISENSFIVKLGNHSTNIWLSHAFFYDYLFSSFIFSPKYSVLIVLKLLVILLIVSIIINKIISLIDKKLIINIIKA